MSFWNLTALPSPRGYGAPVDWDESMDLEQVTCPITDDHMRGGTRIGDLSVVLPSLRIGDIAWTWGSTCLIQDHVLRAFREAGFTGFAVRPVRVTQVRGRLATEPPTLWELVLTGWAGEASEQSGIRMEYYCEGCRTTDYTPCLCTKDLIDPAQWDGSDFFIVWPLPKFIFVTDRVAGLIRSAGYKGVRVLAPEDAGICGDGLGFSPGPPPTGRTVRGPEAFPGAKVERLPDRGSEPA